MASKAIDAGGNDVVEANEQALRPATMEPGTTSVLPEAGDVVQEDGGAPAPVGSEAGPERGPVAGSECVVEQAAAVPVAAESTSGPSVESAAEAEAEGVAEAEADSSNPESGSDSSAEDSSSEGDSSSDDSSSDTESEDGHTLEERQKFLEMEDETTTEPVTTRNEQVEDVLEPDEAIQVPGDAPIELLGRVTTVCDTALVIRAEAPALEQVADQASLVVRQDRGVVGMIADVFGPVKQPYFSVKFRTEAKRAASGVGEGEYVYLVPEHTKYVNTLPLRLVKGSDASNINDEEVAEEDIDYSDDEREAEQRQRRKRARAAAAADKKPAVNKRPRAAQQAYTPLDRPVRGGERHAPRPEAAEEYDPHRPSVMPAAPMYGQFPQGMLNMMPTPVSYWNPMTLPNGAHVNPSFQAPPGYMMYGMGYPGHYGSSPTLPARGGGRGPPRGHRR